uniref:Uncharacterized protein n=1 Tax=Glossina palpalis gambiensis TaxID=67801 RepID=A0A1B0BR40_9MUSC
MCDRIEGSPKRRRASSRKALSIWSQIKSKNKFAILLCNNDLNSKATLKSNTQDCAALEPKLKDAAETVVVQVAKVTDDSKAAADQQNEAAAKEQALWLWSSRRNAMRNSSKYTTDGDSFSSINFTTPSFSKDYTALSTPYTGGDNFNKDKLLPQTQAITEQIVKELTFEQMARIAKNRRLAQGRLAKRLEQLKEQSAGS